MTRQLLIVTAVLGTVACASSSRPAAPPSPSPVASGVGVGVTRGDSTNRRVMGCPGGNGIRISATSGTLTDSTGAMRRDTTSGAKRDTATGPNAVVGLGQALDTTLVFNISRKTWTRTNIAAAISVGIADESRGRYAICAGVNALLPTATLTITGARGTVHFAADLRQFTNSVRVP